MDKNMIHIDDLVRQRLGGGEEDGRAGGWLNMRDLLDQKMPVTPKAGGYNWRRMLGLATGLVLLATATIGSYHVISSTSFRANGETGNGNSNGKIMASAEPGFKPANANDQDRSGSLNGIATNGTNTAHSSDLQNVLASGDADHIGSQPESYPTASGAAPVTSYPHQPVKRQGEPAIINNEKNNINKDYNTPNTAVIAGGTNTAAAQQPLASAAHSPATPAAVSTLAPAKRASQNGTQNDTGKELASAGTNIKRSLQPAVAKQDIIKDTFRQLQVVQRFIVNPLKRTSRLVIDTVSFGKVAIDRKVVARLSSMDEQETTHGAASNSKAYASAAEANTDATLAKAGIQDNIVPLADLKVKSKKTGAWDTRSFQDVVRDMRFNMAQIKFYPGLMLGYNHSIVDNTPFKGFHLGVTSLFTFGDQWGLMADLKYFNRNNGSYVLQDNYVKPVGPSAISKVERFFKFSAMQSIEMPLAIRYTANRLNIFAGPNLVYNFGLNPEEASYTFDPEPDQGTTVKTKPSVFVDDFNGRFAVGGMLGLSYELTPMFQLDLRATRNFWDNAKGTGAQNVSQMLYRAPTFQLSLGYRFSQKSRFPKAK